jgi:cytochrome c
MAKLALGYVSRDIKTISVALLGLMLTACGGDKADAGPPPSPTSQVSTVTLTPLQEQGKKQYARCRACHTLGQGEKHKVGPNLFGFFGEKAGAKEGFNYSKAMTASEVVWTDKTLDAYLTRPRDFMPGNRMSFIGVKEPEKREAIIAYLKVMTTEKSAE